MYICTTQQAITTWQDQQVRWNQWVGATDMATLLGPHDSVAAGEVVERCRFTQFEAEVCNAFNALKDPKSQRPLVDSALKSLQRPEAKVKNDPSKAVPAFWNAAQEVLKK